MGYWIYYFFYEDIHEKKKFKTKKQKKEYYDSIECPVFYMPAYFYDISNFDNIKNDIKKKLSSPKKRDPIIIKIMNDAINLLEEKKIMYMYKENMRESKKIFKSINKMIIDL